MPNRTQTRPSAYVIRSADGRYAGPTFRKRDALRFSRQHPGSKVYALSAAQYRAGGDPFGWDYPTFCVLADRIA